MSYVVIARKFRPVKFEDVVGQEVVTRTLSNALTLGRIAHAYLFSGTRGVGKTTTARLLAKCLNCATGIGPSPCGECAACKEVTLGSALDVLEIDGASNRGINEVRELMESARYSPARDRHKIFIIDEVHMLTTEAFNALLKTLEEPPRHVIFILATTEREKVPATILSRCQKLDFRRLGNEEIASSLRQTCEVMKTTIDGPALHALARAADGSMRDAQSLLEQVMAYAGETIGKGDVDTVLGNVPRALVEETLRAILDGDPRGVLSVIDRLYESGQDPRLFVTSLLEAHRDLIVLATGSDRKATLTEEEVRSLTPLSTGRSLAELLRCAELLARLDRELRLATSPRFVLEMALLEVAEMKRLAPIEEVIGSLCARGSAPEPAPSGGTSRRPSSGSPPSAPPRRAASIAPPEPIRAAAPPSPFLDDARASLGIRAGFIDEVQSVSTDGSPAKVKLVLRSEAGLARQILGSADVMAILEICARRHFGSEATVALGNGGGEPEGQGNPAASSPATDVGGHPLVKKLLDVFQGSVAAVETLGSPEIPKES